MARDGLMRGLLARVIRVMGNSLLRMADNRSADRVQGAAAADPLAELRLRFPSAPEHWLKIVAERAPHLATTDSASVVSSRGGRQRARASADDDGAASPVAAPRSQSRFAVPASSGREPIGHVPRVEEPIEEGRRDVTGAQPFHIPATKPYTRPAFPALQTTPRAELSASTKTPAGTTAAAEPKRADLFDTLTAARTARSAVTSEAPPTKPKWRPIFLSPKTLPVEPAASTVASQPSRRHRAYVAFVDTPHAMVQRPSVASSSEGTVATMSTPKRRTTAQHSSSAAKTASADEQHFVAAPGRNQRQRRPPVSIEAISSRPERPVGRNRDWANAPDWKTTSQNELSESDRTAWSHLELFGRADNPQELWAELPAAVVEPDPAYRAMVVADERRRIDALRRDQIERIWNEWLF